MLVESTFLGWLETPTFCANTAAMETLDASEASTSLYSLSTLESTDEYYYDAATEFDANSEDLEDRAENALWELEEGCDLQLLHVLPIEIVNKVLTYCSATALCHLGRCGTQTLLMTSQSWLWRDLLLRQWGPDLAKGISDKRQQEYQARPKQAEGTVLLKPTVSLSDLSSSAETSAPLDSPDAVLAGGAEPIPSSSSSRPLLTLQLLLDNYQAEHGSSSREPWKAWYRDAHRASRLTKFEVRHGIRQLVEQHGLPNTTGAIARLLKCSTNRIAAFALRDFLHVQANINTTSYFLRLWNFKGLTVLQMMRLVLGFIRLPRSDASISRILEILALAWWEQNEPDEDESASASLSSSPASQSPPSSPEPLAAHPMAHRAPRVMNNAGGEDAQGAQAAPRLNQARITQPIHLAPLSVLDSANPWEARNVPVNLTINDVRPRCGFRSPDAVSVLCFAILMLETDQRTTAVKMKMTESNFISQSRGLNSGHNYPREMLRETYNSIKFHPLVLFSDKIASGRIQVQTTVPRFLWYSSNRTTELRGEVSHGMMRVWERGENAGPNPIHEIPLDSSSTIVRCDYLGPSWLSNGMGADVDNTWNAFEIESLSVLGSTVFKFLVPSEQAQKWFSALHWNIHSSVLESRAP